MMVFIGSVSACKVWSKKASNWAISVAKGAVICSKVFTGAKVVIIC
ncbi:MAG: hypothetical protein J5605_04480 [Bacteroidales bacterium]|nr:hypothetical protein [Bacteroidales bacterium]